MSSGTLCRLDDSIICNTWRGQVIEREAFISSISDTVIDGIGCVKLFFLCVCAGCDNAPAVNENGG